VQCDVTNENSVEKAIAYAIDTFGSLDIVVASAGKGGFSPIKDQSLEMWNDIVGLCLTGVFLTIKHASRVMNKRLWGDRYYGKEATPTTLKRIKVKEMVAWHKANLTLSGALVLVGGDVTLAEVEPLLAKRFAGMNRPAPAVEPAPLPPQASAAPAHLDLAPALWPLGALDPCPGNPAGTALSSQQRPALRGALAWPANALLVSALVLGPAAVRSALSHCQVAMSTPMASRLTRAKPLSMA
jgi:hypothetical protein